MPNIALEKFIANLKTVDESSTKVKLCLRTRKQINSFLSALKDPTNIGIQAITELDLSKSKLNQNDIKELSNVLNTLPKINTLRLNGCSITDDCTIELAKLTHIRILSLNDNLLKNRPAFSTRLTELYLDNNKQISAGQVLFTLSNGAVWLQKLSLKNCGVTDDHLSYVARVGSKLQNLTYLHLSRNNITDIGMGHIATLDYLKTLNVSRNTGVGNDGIKAIKNLRLETLYADNCGIGTMGLISISEMRRLRTVDLSYNPGLKQPWDFSGLAPNDTVRNLKLNFCSLNDQHASALMSQFKALTHFNGGNNNMTKAGVMELLGNKELVALDVSTQQLYRKPTVNNRGCYSPRFGQQEKLSTLRKKVVVDAKEQMSDLLEAIRKSPALTAINVEHTGLTNKMLLSLIPERTDRSRKLKKLNGVSCKVQKAELEQQIKLKEEAKKMAEIEIIATSSKKVELGPESGIDLVSLLSEKEQFIKELQSEIKQLRKELGTARRKITELGNPEQEKTSKSPKKGDVPPLVIPQMFRHLDSRKQMDQPSEASSSAQPIL